MSAAGFERRCLVVALLLFLAIGCSRHPKAREPIHVRPHVRLITPERRTITRTASQPGFIEAYEQTAIYPKVSGFVEKWHVDIGDPIKKGQILLRIAVPELEAEYREKKDSLAPRVARIGVGAGVK
jgi:multidrug efflux pump subunit AcrA (membrane-fusion protein)